jgi:hypothetical protein
MSNKGVWSFLCWEKIGWQLQDFSKPEVGVVRALIRLGELSRQTFSSDYCFDLLMDKYMCQRV